MKLLASIFLCFFSNALYAQGLSNNWLIGTNIPLDSNTTSQLSRLNFYSGSSQILPESRKMKFNGTEANISDKNGNLLISSNGFWIADASGDTMQNGAGLAFNINFSADIPYGFPPPATNLILPWPGDSSKYILFHQMGHAALIGGIKLYYTIIDMNLNNGLGAVISKNNLLATVTNSSYGIGACKHANGRDWWLVVAQDSSNVIYKIFLSPAGISSIASQTFSTILTYSSSVSQPAFSPDGSHFAFTSTTGYAPSANKLHFFDFDRCTGILSNLKSIQINDSATCTGLTFSPNSKLLYFASSLNLYQIKVDSIHFSSNYTTVGIYDGYTPWPGIQTTFNQFYRANDGKIYINSYSTVTDLHFINYPDSAGTLCDLHQHALHLPSYNFETVPNHPNYFLGPLENSTCDSLSGIKNSYNEMLKTIKVAPNPAIGSFGVSYILEQNKTGLLQLFDINGKKVHEQKLPQWSTFQQIDVPTISEGIYSIRLQSGESIRRAKIILQKE